MIKQIIKEILAMVLRPNFGPLKAYAYVRN